ncbi:MAG: LPS-assembly protein LptD [Candidatus Hydrothermia bacterium]
MNLLILLFIASSPLFFEAKHLVYFADSGVFVLKDSVKIKKESTELYADSLIYFRNQKLMKAFGNAVLVFGQDTLVGDSIYYDTETKNGFAFSGTMKQERGIFHGASINKDSTDTVFVAHGTFTTCELSEPHYRFKSWESKIILKDIAIVKPVILEVHSVPIFALPFWIFPLSKERKSGFLVPRFGVNSRDGKYIRNLSYYFVINNYSDLTLNLDMFEKRGVRVVADFVFYRYKFGRINTTYSLAQEWYPAWRRRWSLGGSLEFGPFKGFRITGRGDYYSDNEILNDYSDIKENWLKRELNSYIGFSKSLGRWLISGGMDDRINLSDNFRTSRIPFVQIGVPQIRIGNINITANFNYLRQYTSKDSSDTTRWGLRLNAGTSYSLKIFRYIRFNLFLNGSAGFVDYDTSGKSYPFVKTISGGAGLGTAVYGRTLFGVKGIDFFTHTFQPSINFFFQPEIKNPITDFYFYSAASRKYLNAQITLLNNFGVMVKERNLDFLSMSLSSSSNLLDEANISKFNLWNLSATTLGSIPLSIRFNAVFYRDSLKVKNPSMNISYRLTIPLPRVNFEDTLYSTSRLYIYFNYSLSKFYFVSQMLSFSGNFHLGRSYRINFGGSYDFNRKEIVSKSFSISKDLHCWEASFSYSGFGSRWDYNFRVWIKRLPDVKVEKSIFDLFLP